MNKMTKRKLSKKVLLLEIGIFFLSAFIVLGALGLIWISSMRLPDFSTIASRQLESTSKIYDREGKTLLFAFREKIRRTEIPYSQMNDYMKKATIAIEDDTFYDHKGISFRGILRAFYVNTTTDKQQGGSTITQQVVKNALLTQEKSFERKIKEVILSLKLEQTLSKDQILSMYLNDAPYGGEIYGIEEASQYYFAKNAKDLNLTETAYLAAIPKNPPLYAPYIGKKDKLEERKNTVLWRMLETKNITQTEYNEAIKAKITFVKKEDNVSKAHHFVFFIKDYLEKKYGSDFATQGLRVTTTLDYELQKEIEVIAKNYITNYIKNNNSRKYPIATLNTAVVVLDAKTGQVLSMLGSRDYSDETIDGKYNVATALRQPGSSIKPIVYGAAFEQGLSPETYTSDTPTEFNPDCPRANGLRRDAPCYSPQNFDNSFFGLISLREALGNSRNIPAVKVLYLAGIKNVVTFAKKMGINSFNNPTKYGLSLVLGGAEVSLLELSGAYSVYSQKGVFRKPTGILEIKDKSGKILEKYDDIGYQVILPETAAKISSILSDNSARTRVFGPSSKLYFPGIDVAAKTGTTNNFKDAWVLGYTANTVVGAWIGKNDNTQIGEVAAGISVVPMWNTIFYKVFKKYPPGYLDKEYTGNEIFDGIKCSSSGSVMDIIYTIASLGGSWNGITSADPQIRNWFFGVINGFCGAGAVEPSTTTPETGVTSGDSNVQVGSVPFNGTTPSTPQIPISLPTVPVTNITPATN
jgi:penicillin-binding protein 1C